MNVMLPKSQDQMKAEIAEERMKAKTMRTSDFKKTIAARITAIKMKKESDNKARESATSLTTAVDLLRKSSINHHGFMSSVSPNNRRNAKDANTGMPSSIRFPFNYSLLGSLHLQVDLVTS